MRKIIYAALFLTKEAKAQLLDLVPARHANVHAHHLTLAFKPTPVEVDALLPDLGKTFDFLLGNVLSDERGQCVECWAQSGPVEHLDGAHVTISCAQGVAPVYSRTLLTADFEDLVDIDLDDRHVGMKLQGRLGFFVDGQPVYDVQSLEPAPIGELAE